MWLDIKDRLFANEKRVLQVIDERWLRDVRDVWAPNKQYDMLSLVTSFVTEAMNMGEEKKR